MKILKRLVVLTILLSVSNIRYLCRAIDTVCCPEVGCFSKDPPFDDIPKPQCPEQMNIQMRLYTKDDPTEGQVISRTYIPSSFNGKLHTIFVAPGWQHSEKTKWPREIKDTLIPKCNCNVIIALWTGGAQHINYLKSASNTRTVGAEIALVANKTINGAGSHQSRLNCIGFSLGGHVCGHAGQRRKFGRIIGLDPAGPWFETKDWTSGLNPSCADRVEVIHTNGEACLPLLFGLGTLKVLGHIDFYPNGGGVQPGCKGILTSPVRDTRSLEDALSKLSVSQILGCCHVRAVDLFRESILDPRFFSRNFCSTESGMCLPKQSQNTAIIQNMGFRSIDYSTKGRFYVKTSSSSPFSLG